MGEPTVMGKGYWNPKNCTGMRALGSQKLHWNGGTGIPETALVPWEWGSHSCGGPVRIPKTRLVPQLRDPMGMRIPQLGPIFTGIPQEWFSSHRDPMGMRIPMGIPQSGPIFTRIPQKWGSQGNGDPMGMGGPRTTGIPWHWGFYGNGDPPGMGVPWEWGSHRNGGSQNHRVPMAMGIPQEWFSSHRDPTGMGIPEPQGSHKKEDPMGTGSQNHRDPLAMGIPWKWGSHRNGDPMGMVLQSQGSHGNGGSQNHKDPTGMRIPWEGGPDVPGAVAGFGALPHPPEHPKSARRERSRLGWGGLRDRSRGSSSPREGSGIVLGFPQGSFPGFPQGLSPGKAQGSFLGFPQGLSPGFPREGSGFLGFPQGLSPGRAQGLFWGSWACPGPGRGFGGAAGGLGPVVGVQVVNDGLDEVGSGGVTAQIPSPDLQIQQREGKNGRKEL
ncbi:collagen alpha-2(VIII) chain-like isoform X1 [Parus major]|uniref:collagen alpha-2(VIII) chain-like isoform X1 n=1 Tax=Parus major TaxID=9157 RepID=UPI0014441562|nr:collagen alpha-2(VIII) chain-like isoform X1 [Parus major]